MAGAFPTVDAAAIGWLDERQMIEVDRVMVDDLHIELIQMMENAGRNLARLVLDLFAPRTAVIYAGSGGNGGGGLVAARHLANAGVSIAVELSRDAIDLDGVPGHQYDILRRMGVASPPVGHFDVGIDALIGYSLRGAPRGRTRELMEGMATAVDVIVSLDTPSGLDVTTGDVTGVVVQADATMTLALPKTVWLAPRRLATSTSRTSPCRHRSCGNWALRRLISASRLCFVSLNRPISVGWLLWQQQAQPCRRRRV